MGKLKDLLQENQGPDEDEEEEFEKFEWLNEFGEKKYHEVQPDEDHVTFSSQDKKETEEQKVENKEEQVENVEEKVENEEEQVEVKEEKAEIDATPETADTEDSAAESEAKPEIIEAVLEEEAPKVTKKPIRKRKQRK